MMSRKRYLLSFLLLPFLLAQAPDGAHRKGAVTLTGTITAPDPITKIVAVDRPWADVLKVSVDDPKDDFVYPGTIDPKTGDFSIPNLLPGRTYDLIVWTKPANGSPVRWEGISMDYYKEVKPSTPAEQADKDWISTFVEKTPRFEDKCRVLWMAADHQHATALVELARTKEFHSGKGGEIIVRAELWYFENYFGGWAMDNNTEKVMDRWRGEGAKFPETWQFVPDLGGHVTPAEGKPEPIKITLPKVDAKRGPSKAEWMDK